MKENIVVLEFKLNECECKVIKDAASKKYFAHVTYGDGGDFASANFHTKKQAEDMARKLAQAYRPPQNA